MNKRLTLDDTPQTAIVKLAGGNPGATIVCAELFKRGPDIDPDNFMGGFGQLVNLDSFGIYSADIWMLYKDVCKQNIVHVVAVLRAVQMGLLTREALHHAIQNRGQGVDVADVFKQVCQRLPNFDDANALEATEISL